MLILPFKAAVGCSLTRLLCFVQLLHYSEEKIGLSQQIYDYVDQRIRRLDKDLKAFESDISKERARLGIPVSAPHLYCYSVPICPSLDGH